MFSSVWRYGPHQGSTWCAVLQLSCSFAACMHAALLKPSTVFRLCTQYRVLCRDIECQQRHIVFEPKPGAAPGQFSRAHAVHQGAHCHVIVHVVIHRCKRTVQLYIISVSAQFSSAHLGPSPVVLSTIVNIVLSTGHW